MSHSQEHDLDREVPRFEPWLGWTMLTFIPAIGLVLTPAAYDRPLIIATVVMLAIAFASFIRQTTRRSRDAVATTPAEGRSPTRIVG